MMPSPASTKFPTGRRSEVLPFRLFGLLSLIALALPGCGGTKPPPGPPEELKQAVEQLQRGQPQRALETLGELSTPRSRWLKSIALERLDQLDDAKAQIAEALKQEPDNREFQGLNQRLELYSSKLEAADEILKLYDADKSSAALALFAFYAHTARGVALNALKKPDEAVKEGGKGIAALQSAVRLNAEIPEFQRELLSLAAKTQLAAEADLLSEKLTQISPDDVDLVAERAAVLAMLQQHNKAVPVAAKLYELRQKDVGTARFYAAMLTQSALTAENERRLRSLANDHPGELGLLTQLGVYLVRAGRTGDAVQEIESAVRKQTDPKLKQTMLAALMGLALEAADVQQAALVFERHRTEFADPLTLAYFDGRVRVLKRDFAGALEKFSVVVQGEKEAPGSHRALAAEALFWTQAILNDREAARELGEAADAIRIRAGLPPLNAPTPAEAEIPESGESRTGTK